MFTTQTLVQQMARGFARHAATQQTVVARNIANADTPGYRAQRLDSFAALVGDPSPGPRASRESHLQRPQHYAFEAREETGNGNPNGNSVSLEAEMVEAAYARQNHEMALAIQSSFSTILRSALGRRG